MSASADDGSKNSEIQVGEESVRSSVVVTYEFE
jgi:hypothetical protein